MVAAYVAHFALPVWKGCSTVPSLQCHQLMLLGTLPQKHIAAGLPYITLHILPVTLYIVVHGIVTLLNSHTHMLILCIVMSVHMYVGGIYLENGWIHVYRETWYQLQESLCECARIVWLGLIWQVWNRLQQLQENAALPACHANTWLHAAISYILWAS